MLPTSHQTALIEVLQNTVSVHSIKRCLPPGTSLAQHFFRLFPPGSAACSRAQQAFAQSLAAYSLVCYLLQIKDRHNANILMDTEVRSRHPGFMTSRSHSLADAPSMPLSSCGVAPPVALVGQGCAHYACRHRTCKT